MAQRRARGESRDINGERSINASHQNGLRRYPDTLIEQDVIFPLRVGLEFLRTSVHWPPAGFIQQEDPGQTVGNFPSYLDGIRAKICSSVGTEVS
jgi:hypothetical protein